MLLAAACAPVAAPATPTPQLSRAEPASLVNTFPPLSTPGVSLRFTHYSLEQGLSQSSPRAIAQDASGFLWIGTQDGLNRFDGYAFRVFRPIPGDPDSLVGSEVNSIVPGEDGAVWIATNSALNLYDPVTGHFSHWRHSDSDPGSLVGGTVMTLLKDARGILWIGTHEGLDRFDPQTGKFVHISLARLFPARRTPPSVRMLFEDSTGIMWIGTDVGLIRYDPLEGAFLLYEHTDSNTTSLGFNEVTAIGEDPGGRLWIGTTQGISRLDTAMGRFSRFLHSDNDASSLADNIIQTIYVDRGGQVWIGTRGGLDRYDPGTQRFLHYQSDSADPQSLSSNSVACIFEDRGGVLWIGTDGGGLNKHDRGTDQFAYYKHVASDPESLSGDLIFAILAAPNGQAWIGTSQAGLNLFDPDTGRAQHFRHDPRDPDSLLSDNVRSLFLDSNGSLWVGTDRGLDRLDQRRNRFIHYVSDPAAPNSIPSGSVYEIYQDRELSYWVGTAQGIRKFDPNTGSFARLEAGSGVLSGLADGPARAILQDQTGSMWFGTDSHGLYRLGAAGSGVTHFTYDPIQAGSLSSDAVMSIFQDRGGKIWIATFGGGVDLFLPESQAFESFTQLQGLPNDVVYGVVEDDSGSLWMSTNLGLSRLDPSSRSFRNYTVQDGLQSNEFNSSAFGRDARGRLYFGGVRGLTVFDPAQLRLDPYAPPIAITSLTLQDGTPASPDHTANSLTELTLAYPRNSFDVRFSAMSFAQENANRYSYMLEGFDKSWRDSGSDRQASYTNLPGGTYVLRVRASNADGVWNEQGRAVTITVIPPFWLTWPFASAALLVLVAMATLGYRWRMRDARLKRLELERIIHDRTQELKRQNRDLEALYAADARMLRVLSQEDVFRALVDVAIDVLQADKSAVLERAEGDERFSVRVSRGFQSAADDPVTFAGTQHRILREVAAGAPRLYSDTPQDDAWKRQPRALVDLMAAEGVRSILYIPILVQEAVVGVLNVSSSSPRAFNEDRQRLFTSLVQRAALSIENSQLFEQTRQMAILEERNRLAQELHDSAKQKAFAALAQLGAAKKLAKQDLKSATARLAEAEDIVSEVIHDLAYFIQGSYPKDLEEKGFVESLRSYAYAWQTRSAIPLRLTIHGERRLPLPVEQLLYRIVQEGMSNIARHSGATEASIGITYGDRDLQIEIIDNGRGFDESRTNGGLGLRLIHERLQSLGGEVEIASRPGGGTHLSIRTPINGTH
ncbi:MAG TPA: two-component regulator propeller domain-containing protein [Anaerolineales bacterium]